MADTEKPRVSDADMLARFQKSKKRPPCSDTLGMRLAEVEQDAQRIRMDFDVSPSFANPTGAVQGGFVSAMLDEVMSLAGSIAQDGPAMSPTLQMTTSYLRPVPIGERLLGRGECVRRGRAALFTRGELTREDGTLLAQATASCIPRALPSGT